MKTIPPKLLLTIIGAFLFNLLFWNEKLGLNLLLFDGFIIGAVLLVYPLAASQRSARWILLAHFISIAMVLVHNTGLSKIAASLTIILFAGFAEHLHRSVLFAGGTMVFQSAFFLPEFFGLLRTACGANPVKKKRSQRWRIMLFPGLLLMLFFIIYIIANSAFASIAGNFFELLANYFERMFERFSFGRIMFALLGAYVTGALIVRNHKSKFSDKELALSDRLLRIKKSKGEEPGLWHDLVFSIMGKYANGILALKVRARVGLISLVLLNFLLLMINITDVLYIWTGDEYGKDGHLAALLHEGTGMLIFSILLAIAVVLYFFDGNINFYKKSKALKIAALAWIIQNAFLVSSVFMRDYYYISVHGLAYKRIGVLFFLALVLIGLATVVIKIYRRKSGYFLFRVNGNAALIMLIVASCLNWDYVIARYNLARIDVIDPDAQFLMSLSDHTLPLMKTYQPKLKSRKAFQDLRVYDFNRYELVGFEEALRRREMDFLSSYNSYSWLSWNYADSKVYNKLKRAKTPVLPALSLK